MVRNIYSAAHEYGSIRDNWARSPSFIQDAFPKLTPVLSEQLHSNGFRPAYPDGKQFAVCVSHDVDWIHQPLSRSGFFKAAVRGALKGDIRTASFAGKNLLVPVEKPEWSLRRLIDREAEQNIRATYFFLSLAKGDWDYNYAMDTVERYRPLIDLHGNEIGLHGGHETTVDQNRLTLEKSRLETALGYPIQGHRSHYLKFRTPHTWQNLKDAGFAYDTTFGFADLAGYRNGLCYPFRPFDQETGAYIDLIEIPLIVMDVTLWKYMNLGLEASLALVQRMIDDVQRLNGVFTLLWHNHSFNGQEGEIYTRVIDYLVERDPWFATSGQVAEHWRKENLPAMEAQLPME